ncbi:branched-chain amino acid ABC transporter permease [Oceanibacterium hippocampi]|uniref:Leucine/isoleucine/valine transporter permease subunit n=1 Tax=Oceanibacterium hippocampi TaxID=745714 RepID=A0A1Y5RWQ6_9PROT|nr:branched-chain amino acid ABC transporter permease [Oceanibacterium hippocampi]SLN26961.1 leucine/isoleucine/valine transporter permease subunit [Oceanibacterium hippocampi]
MRRPSSPLTVAVWAVLALCPLVVDDWNLGLLAQLMIYGIFAMSLSFIWGQGGLLCFGQALFFGLGAYAMALTTKGLLPGVPASALVGFLLALALPGTVAFLLGLALFRGRGLVGPYFGIVTLAAAVIAERLAVNWNYIGGFNGLLDIPPLTFGSGDGAIEIFEPLPIFLIVFGAALVVYLLLLGLERSPFGTVLRGIRDNEMRAAFMGYDVARYKAASFAVAAAVAGFAGALFAIQFAFVSPAILGFALSTEVLIWVALGGKEVLLAAFLGALVVKSVENVLSDALGQYWLLVLGILFILSVVLLPRGLLAPVFRLRLPRGLRGGG